MDFWETLRTDGWWLEHALDGIGAGIVGGAVTGLAVWWTVTHERKLRAEDRREASRDEVRLALARVHGCVVQVRWLAGQVHWVETYEGMQRVRSELIVAEAIARRPEPVVAAALETLREDLDAVPKTQLMYDRGGVRRFKDDAELRLAELLAEVTD